MIQKGFFYFVLIISFGLTLTTCAEQNDLKNSKVSKNKTELESEYSGLAYPDQGNYGENLLIENTITIDTGKTYSLRVNLLDSNSSLKVRFYLPQAPWGSNIWFYSAAPAPINYAVTGSNYREFQTGTSFSYSDANISFSGSNSVLLEIYENDAVTPTRTKTISW